MWYIHTCAHASVYMYRNLHVHAEQEYTRMHVSTCCSAFILTYHKETSHTYLHKAYPWFQIILILIMYANVCMHVVSVDVYACENNTIGVLCMHMYLCAEHITCIPGMYSYNMYIHIYVCMCGPYAHEVYPHMCVSLFCSKCTNFTCTCIAHTFLVLQIHLHKCMCMLLCLFSKILLRRICINTNIWL